MASADFCKRLRGPLDPRSTAARLQISPGIAHPSSRLCASDIRHRVPYMYWALHLFACSPHGAASIRFLFVAPALCFRLPSDSRSPETPLPFANTCPCRLCRGLAPPNECALPGAQKKTPLSRGFLRAYFPDLATRQHAGWPSRPKATYPFRPCRPCHRRRRAHVQLLPSELRQS
jgi:hypothetical protein